MFRYKSSYLRRIHLMDVLPNIREIVQKYNVRVDVQNIRMIREDNLRKVLKMKFIEIHENGSGTRGIRYRTMYLRVEINAG